MSQGAAWLRDRLAALSKRAACEALNFESWWPGTPNPRNPPAQEHARVLFAPGPLRFAAARKQPPTADT